MKIYVASSWRNHHQQGVVAALREDGHDVYDFRTPGASFSWAQIDEDWLQWRPHEYLAALIDPVAKVGFDRDMTALRECDVCVMVMPCGPSASLETGWAVGAGKRVAVYVAEQCEPDLMVKMAEYLTDSLHALRHWCNIRKLSVNPLAALEGR